MRRLLFLFVCLFASGWMMLACSGGLGVSEEDKSEHYIPLSRKFGEHVLREEWSAAYAMLSNDLRNHFTEQAFVDAIKGEYGEYHQFGVPIAVGGAFNTGDPAEITREDFDIPDYVPDTPRWEAYSFSQMVIEGTAEDPYRCYDIGLLWVNEGGEDRIAHFEQFWCD